MKDTQALQDIVNFAIPQKKENNRMKKIKELVKTLMINMEKNPNAVNLGKLSRQKFFEKNDPSEYGRWMAEQKKKGWKYYKEKKKEEIEKGAKMALESKDVLKDTI